MVKKNITVTIPPRKEFNVNTYVKQNSCYLAQALKKNSHKDVYVSGFGRTTIGKITYKPLETFNNSVVKKAFAENRKLKVVLVPID